jgi:hypothetical protein
MDKEGMVAGVSAFSWSPAKAKEYFLITQKEGEGSHFQSAYELVLYHKLPL